MRNFGGECGGFVVVSDMNETVSSNRGVHFFRAHGIREKLKLLLIRTKRVCLRIVLNCFKI